MSPTKLILRALGLLVTIILQIIVSFLILFLFTVIFAGVDTVSRLGWLLLLFFIWLAYVLGINLVGQAALRWVWKDIRLLWKERLVGTMIGAAIPLLILVPIGYSVPVGDEGSRFYNLVTNNWQPILAQAALFAAIVGYFAPSIMVRRDITTESTVK